MSAPRILMSLICIGQITSIHNIEDNGWDNAVEIGDSPGVSLGPVQLMDLVLQEENQRTSSTTLIRNMRKAKDLFAEQKKTRDGVHQAPTTKTWSDEGEQEVDPMKGRKVWSRWSKWGECSVSCGEGMIARRRMCLAGRCADGEREEQRRPCARHPCPAAPTAAPTQPTDESHELE